MLRFRKVALDQSSGIEEFGQPKWDLVLCLMFAWIICFLCLIKGIKSTGKVTIHRGSDVMEVKKNHIHVSTEHYLVHVCESLIFVAVGKMEMSWGEYFNVI
jgi:hypothetical protein